MYSVQMSAMSPTRANHFIISEPLPGNVWPRSTCVVHEAVRVQFWLNFALPRCRELRPCSWIATAPFNKELYLEAVAYCIASSFRGKAALDEPLACQLVHFWSRAGIIVGRASRSARIAQIQLQDFLQLVLEQRHKALHDRRTTYDGEI